MKHEVTLGQIPDEHACRDAIHIAVAPVVAAHMLSPGQHVGLDQDGLASADARPIIGVVDPFRLGHVHSYTRFWLCLHPNTITSLRHEWAHPAFGGVHEHKGLPWDGSIYIEYDSPEYKRYENEPWFQGEGTYRFEDGEYKGCGC